MKLLYLKTIETFEKQETIDKFKALDLPHVKHVDLYKGQDYNEQAFEAHLRPALFIKWNIDYKTRPALATVTFRLCWEQLRDTSSLNTDNTEALKFLDFIDKVDEILKEIQTEHTGAFTLATEELNIEDTITDTVSLVYTCTYSGKENTAVVNYKKGIIDETEGKGELFKVLVERD
ncbi:conserved hypothetical protein [Tenacibaculum maritimum]|uniref:hypothetical protein n=1 Tax=Tenacibaculum maritimum TaxID=107401 RepID=UPI0012E5AFF0|nr:hypothetical protein [Tenacibaculum maritimum]MCD9582295.1 hypothetical protein [Tenacibaculum maritimum]MCD9636677.1 hypothetical protein [Tenacibaculum maritimum]CAA0144767.1 conserved hypothetical protein [Tenacibaculum maritimum]CAA0193066.1 conserved hypothetical protein [Tenacibaculum maritimum]